MGDHCEQIQHAYSGTKLQRSALIALLCMLSAHSVQRLQEALAESQFNRALDDAHMWLRDCEVLLASSDLGKDLTSVQHLLKKHQVRV